LRSWVVRIKAIKMHLDKLILHHTESFRCVKTHYLNCERESEDHSLR
jgi:hypothetical protein